MVNIHVQWAGFVLFFVFQNSYWGFANVIVYAQCFIFALMMFQRHCCGFLLVKSWYFPIRRFYVASLFVQYLYMIIVDHFRKPGNPTRIALQANINAMVEEQHALDNKTWTPTLHQLLYYFELISKQFCYYIRKKKFIYKKCDI